MEGPISFDILVCVSTLVLVCKCACTMARVCGGQRGNYQALVLALLPYLSQRLSSLMLAILVHPGSFHRLLRDTLRLQMHMVLDQLLRGFWGSELKSQCFAWQALFTY